MHIVLDAVSAHGHSFTVRKFREKPFTIVELINSRMIDAGIAAVLWLAVESKQGVIFFGPTGSGKTTLLNAVAMMIPSEMKIVTAEDTQEIRLPFHESWTATVTRLSRDQYSDNITLQTQIESAMRQRPDVVILGEIRSREAYAFFQAVSTGHGGLTTIHAESSEALVKRLTSQPMNVPKSFLATAKLLVHVVRLLYRGSVARKVIYIHEIEGWDPKTDTISTKVLCKWDREKDIWLFNFRESSFVNHVATLMLTSYNDVLEELVRRATVLLYAAKKNLDVVQLHALLRRYRREPEAVYREAEKVVGRYNFNTFETIEREAL